MALNFFVDLYQRRIIPKGGPFENLYSWNYLRLTAQNMWKSYRKLPPKDKKKQTNLKVEQEKMAKIKMERKKYANPVTLPGSLWSPY